MSDQSRVVEEARRQPDDFDWAVERVTAMCAGALVDAQFYRQKLLKGFGYPNETFSRAQDYRALSIVLERLRALLAAQEADNGAMPSPNRVLDRLPRYGITGRYGGNYEAERRDTGEWVRWSDVEQALVIAAQEAAPSARVERRDADAEIVRDLMQWAPACPNAEGKGIIYGLLDRARAMLDRWGQEGSPR